MDRVGPGGAWTFDEDGLPRARTERLVLRAHQSDDLADLCAAIDDERVAATTLRIPHPYSEQDGRDWVRVSREKTLDGSAVLLAIALPTEGRPLGTIIGNIGLSLEPRHSRAEIGFWLAPARWGLGYATEATRAVIGFAFAELGVNRVFGCHFPGNEASRRVQEKAGMRAEGLLRQNVRKTVNGRDVFLDEHVMSILRREWRSGT